MDSQPQPRDHSIHAKWAEIGKLGRKFDKPFGVELAMRYGQSACAPGSEAHRLRALAAASERMNGVGPETLAKWSRARRYSLHLSTEPAKSPDNDSTSPLNSLVPKRAERRSSVARNTTHKLEVLRWVSMHLCAASRLPAGLSYVFGAATYETTRLEWIAVECASSWKRMHTFFGPTLWPLLLGDGPVANTIAAASWPIRMNASLARDLVGHVAVSEDGKHRLGFEDGDAPLCRLSWQIKDAMRALVTFGNPDLDLSWIVEGSGSLSEAQAKARILKKTVPRHSRRHPALDHLPSDLHLADAWWLWNLGLFVGALIRSAKHYMSDQRHRFKARNCTRAVQFPKNAPTSRSQNVNRLQTLSVDKSSVDDWQRRIKITSHSCRRPLRTLVLLDAESSFGRRSGAVWCLAAVEQAHVIYQRWLGIATPRPPLAVLAMEGRDARFEYWLSKSHIDVMLRDYLAPPNYVRPIADRTSFFPVRTNHVQRARRICHRLRWLACQRVPKVLLGQFGQSGQSEPAARSVILVPALAAQLVDDVAKIALRDTVTSRDQMYQLCMRYCAGSDRLHTVRLDDDTWRTVLRQVLTGSLPRAVDFACWLFMADMYNQMMERDEMLVS